MWLNMVQKKQLSRKEIEEKQKEHEQIMQTDYTEYTKRIEARQSKGEKIELKPFEDWKRKVKKTVDGIEQEIEVPGDSGETGAERFKRLVEKRMVKVLDSLDLIVNLSSPQYDSTEKQQKQIVDALKLKVMDIENSFKSQTKVERFILEE